MNDKLQGEVGEFFILDEAKDAPSLLDIVKKANKKPTVFETITTSPEVLANELVFCIQDDLGSYWTSHFIDGYRKTRDEAYHDTVAMLKEVAE